MQALGVDGVGAGARTPTCCWPNHPLGPLLPRQDGPLLASDLSVHRDVPGHLGRTCREFSTPGCAGRLPNQGGLRSSNLACRNRADCSIRTVRPVRDPDASLRPGRLRLISSQTRRPPPSRLAASQAVGVARQCGSRCIAADRSRSAGRSARHTTGPGRRGGPGAAALAALYKPTSISTSWGGWWPTIRRSSARTLRVANSTFYRRSGEVGTVSRAYRCWAWPRSRALRQPRAWTRRHDAGRCGRREDRASAPAQPGGGLRAAQLLARQARPALRGRAFMCGVLR